MEKFCDWERPATIEAPAMKNECMSRQDMIYFHSPP